MGSIIPIARINPKPYLSTSLDLSQIQIDAPGFAL